MEGKNPKKMYPIWIYRIGQHLLVWSGVGYKEHRKSIFLIMWLLTKGQLLLYKKSKVKPLVLFGFCNSKINFMCHTWNGKALCSIDIMRRCDHAMLHTFVATTSLLLQFLYTTIIIPMKSWALDADNFRRCSRCHCAKWSHTYTRTGPFVNTRQ